VNDVFRKVFSVDFLAIFRSRNKFLINEKIVLNNTSGAETSVIPGALH
jgi:hypothetical protein